MESAQKRYDASEFDEDEVRELARKTASALTTANVPHRGPDHAGPRKSIKEIFGGLIKYETTIQYDGGNPRFWVVDQYVERAKRYTYAFTDGRPNETHTDVDGLAILLTVDGNLLVADLKIRHVGELPGSIEPDGLPGVFYAGLEPAFSEGALQHLDFRPVLGDWEDDEPIGILSLGRKEVWRQELRKQDTKLVHDQKGAGLKAALRAMTGLREEDGVGMAATKRCPECKFTMMANPGRDEPHGTWYTYVCQNGDCPSVKRGHPHSVKEFVTLR